MFNTPDLKVYH